MKKKYIMIYKRQEILESHDFLRHEGTRHVDEDP